MKLYADQLLASKQFEEWLNNSNVPAAGLWASAGFGKSYSMKHFVEEVVLKNSNYKPVITSMTHSAVGVLRDFVGLGVTTLHSHMGWIPYVNKETGEEGISTPRMRDANADPRLNSETILMIDEAGLLGHSELRELMKEVAETGARVLFIGDNKQCFPVFKEGEEECIPAYEYTKVRFELTEPKRTSADDMIYKLALKTRATVDGGQQPKLRTILNSDGKTGVRYVDDIEEMAYAAFRAGLRDGNADKIKVLAFTNKRCLTLNRKIRKKVMGLSDPTPTVGEVMIANTSIQASATDDCLIRNNELVVVKDIEKTSSFGLEGAFIQYVYAEGDEAGEEVAEIVFVPSTPAKLLDRLKKIAAEAKNLKAAGEDEDASKAWRTFFSLKEGCADIRFTYAMTINKAQGVTLHHALVDLDDINKCRSYEQKCRMFYTAGTRPTTYLTIEGELTKW